MRSVILFSTSLAIALSATVPTIHSRQEANKPRVKCTAVASRAWRHLPRLTYKCRSGIDEYDEAILKWPERLRALNLVVAQLKNLSADSWWRSRVEDLNACDARSKTPDSEPPPVNLLGDHNLRLVIIRDPCYQPGYNGSALYLLARSAGATNVQKIIDGYFSRVDDSIGFDSVAKEGSTIVEVSTGNNMPPSLTNYYFAFNPKTRRVEPANLFQEGTSLTNKIYSDMLMSSPEDLGLKDADAELNVIQNHQLATSFSAYNEDPDGKIESVDKHFKRIVYHWNGRFYEPQ